MKPMSLFCQECVEIHVSTACTFVSTCRAFGARSEQGLVANVDARKDLSNGNKKLACCASCHEHRSPKSYAQA